MPKTRANLAIVLFGLFGVALLAAACGGVSKAAFDELEAEHQRKADAASLVQIANVMKQDFAAQENDITALRQQIQDGPDLDAVNMLINDKFTNFEKGVPLWDVQPGTAPRMRQFTESFNLMWFAAQAENWEFAGFEVYRAGEEAKGILITRPGRAEALNEWTEPNLKALDAAVKAKDKAAFERAYDDAIAGCNTCHAESKGGGFEMKAIKVIRPTTPLYPNLDFKGQ